MNQKQFRKYLDRDDGCVHCGETEAVSPHHRLNRGMGGSKERDVPSNIIVLCSALNSALESDAKTAARAKTMGWKLESGQDYRSEAIFHYRLGWVLLDDDFGVIRHTEANGV